MVKRVGKNEKRNRQVQVVCTCQKYFPLLWLLDLECLAISSFVSSFSSFAYTLFIVYQLKRQSLTEAALRSKLPVFPILYLNIPHKQLSLEIHKSLLHHWQNSETVLFDAFFMLVCVIFSFPWLETYCSSTRSILQKM